MADHTQIARKERELHAQLHFLRETPTDQRALPFPKPYDRVPLATAWRRLWAWLMTRRGGRTWHARYIGPVEHLRGKGALVRAGRGHNRVLAQFDDRTATLSGLRIERHNVVLLEHEPHARFPAEQTRPPARPPADALGFGWHEFDAAEFQEVGS